MQRKCFRASIPFSVILVFALALSAQSRAAKPVIVKMATLAPEGSPWHQVLQEIGEDWRELSKNEVRLRIYAGGVAGDESDMVRKMRIGQIQAAALTAEGLSYIDKGIYGLSYPMMVKNYAELDWVREQVEPELVRRYEAKGFKVLTWADVGFVYWFTRDPVRTPTEMQSQRIFTWAGDPNSPRLWTAAGFQPVSLSATDVLPALQTGLIDALSSTPLTVAALQLFGTANNMLNMPWAAMTGAVIIDKATWDLIPADLQPKLLEAVNQRSKRIHEEIRYSDAAAIEVMQGYGLTVIEADESVVAAWRALIDEHGKSLRGTLIDTTMFDRIMEINNQIHQPGFVLPQ